MTSLLIALYLGPKIIRKLQKKQIGEEIRNLGLEGQLQKRGTPTMGGIIFIISISIVAMICFKGQSQLAKMTILIFIAYGLVGFLDEF